MADINLQLPWKADDLAEDYARNQLDRDWAEYKRRLEMEGGGPEVLGAPGKGTEEAAAAPTTLPELTSLETAPTATTPIAPAAPSALVEGVKAAGETIVGGVQHVAGGMFEDRPGEMVLGGMEIMSALPAGVGTAVQQAMKNFAPGMEAATAIPEGNVAGLLRTFLATPGLLLDPAQAKAMEDTPQELAADLKKPVTFGELANILSQIATPFAGKAAKATARATKEQIPNILSQRGSVGEPPPEGVQKPPAKMSAAEAAAQKPHAEEALGPAPEGSRGPAPVRWSGWFQTMKKPAFEQWTFTDESGFAADTISPERLKALGYTVPTPPEPRPAPQPGMYGSPVDFSGKPRTAGPGMGEPPPTGGPPAEPPPPGGRTLPTPPEGAEARINLARQQAPESAKQVMEDISRIISTRPEIIASRTRVTHAETIAEAAKWTLDRVLGLTPGDLTMAEVRGFQLAARDYFNAASQHVDDLAKRTVAGDAAAAAQWDAAELILGRLAELQEMPGTELARALESRKIEGTVERAQGFTPENVSRIAAMRPDASVPAAVRAAQYMALGTKAQRAEYFREKWAAVVRGKDIAHELWINMLLTNPATHAANVVGTGMSVAWNLPEHWVAEIVNKLFTRDPEGVQRGETAGMVRAIPQALSDGIRLAQKAAAKEMGKGTELTGTEQALIAQSRVEVEQNLPAILRIPTIALGIEDAATKGITYRLELSGLALRQARREGKIGPALDARVAELEAHPPGQMIAEAVDQAMLRTLNAELGPAGQMFMRWANSIPGGRLIMPFIRTPTNAAKWFGQRAPILGQISAQNWRDIMAGGAARDKAIARQVVGMGVSAVVLWEVAQGNITGAGDPDRRLRSVEREERPAYSIRVGDSWYTYSRTDPVGALIGLLADYAEITGRIPTQDDLEYWGAYAEGIGLAVGQVMVNKTYMRGLADVLEAMKDPHRNVGKVASGWARSIVPAGVRAVTRQMDDNIIRDTRGMLDEIKAGIPYWAESLPPERNPVTGEPIRFPPGWGPDMLSPIYVTAKRNDPVFEEILKNRITLPLVPRYVGPGERTEGAMMQEPRGGQRSHKLTPKQRDYWIVAMTQLARDWQGETLHEALTTLVRSPKYQDQSEGTGSGRDVLIREIYKSFMDRGEIMLRRESLTLEGRIRDLQEQKIRRQLPKTDPRSPQYGTTPQSLTR